MKKILLVEDEKELADVITLQLKENGFDVEVAYDGIEGLEKALDYRPDLILLDIIMPKMDGMTMLKKLRKDHWGAGVKVILLTNLDDNTRVAEAVKQHSFDYLVKADWNIKDVIKLIKEKIGD